MARQRVVQIQCDRCRRQEFVPEEEKVGSDFDASFLDQRLVYGDLCGRCKETISNIWVLMKEWQKEVKYTILNNNRIGPILSDNEAAPNTPAPNYMPPQPHSAAADKR